MKQGMHNGNDGWLTHRLMRVVLFCFVTLALNGAWVCASIKRQKTKEGGRNAFGCIKIVYFFLFFQTTLLIESCLQQACAREL
jgi:hypothetical protein